VSSLIAGRQWSGLKRLGNFILKKEGRLARPFCVFNKQALGGVLNLLHLPLFGFMAF